MWSAVFYLEYLRTGRRLRHQIARWAFAAWLLLMLLVGSAGAGRFVPCCLPAGLLPTESFATPAEMLIVQQFLLALLVVPPFSAGAVTEEKALGTLDQLLMSALTPWQIVVGKFAARVAQVGTISLAGLPLLCWFGGLDGVAFAAVLVAEAGVLGCLGGLSILATVLTRTTSSAVLGAYAASALLLAAVRYLGGPFRCLDPLYLLEPALTSRLPEELGMRTILSGVAWSSLTLSCLALAAWQLRPAYLRQYLDKGDEKKLERRAARGPLLGDDPLRWKESHVKVFSPLPLLCLLPRWAGVVAAASAGVLISASTLTSCLPSDIAPATFMQAAAHGDFAVVFDVLGRLQSPEWGFLVQGLLALVFLAVVVNLRAASGISGEREKGTWDALLLAGMTGNDMIRGKLLGILDSTRPYLFAYGIPALFFAAVGGGLSFLATLGPLVLAWQLMYLAGAVALERSTRYLSAWKCTADALIVTALLIVGLIYGTFVPVLGMLMAVIAPFHRAGSTASLVIAAGFLLIYAGFLAWLLRHVARDYIKGAALTIERKKGELPEMRYTIQLIDPVSPRGRWPRDG